MTQKKFLGVADSSVQDQDHFLNTVKNRGFFVKLSPEKLLQKATIFEYDVLCQKIEALMAAFVQQDSQAQFSTFIINTMLQTQKEWLLVEQELLSIWATVYSFKDKDILITVYSDFLNDILQGPNHLTFFMHTQKIISQIINGDLNSHG